MKLIPDYLKNVKAWGAVALMVFAIYGGAASVGLDIPRWTWFSEHQVQVAEVKKLRMYAKTEHLKLASASNNNRARILTILLKSARSRYYRNRVDQKMQIRKGIDVDTEMIKEEADLIGQIDELEDELKKIRGR